MTATQTADQFLMGGGVASAKFETIGATITGTIADPPEVTQRTDPKDGLLQFWPSGDPQMQLVVTLQTTQREDEDDDGKRKVYVKGKSLTEAVREAVKKTGAKGLEVGGTLTVTFVAEGPQPNRALNAPKLYTATYARPDGVAQSASFLGVQETAPVASGPAQPTPEQVAAVKLLGIDVKAVYPNYDGPPF